MKDFLTTFWNIISKSIKKYGVRNTIMTTFLVCFTFTFMFATYRIDKWLDVRLEQQTKNIILTQKTSHEENLNKRIDITPFINAELERTCLILKSKKIFVGEYHDGVENIHGLPFFKFTITYEYDNPKYDTQFDLSRYLHDQEVVNFSFVDFLIRKESVVLTKSNENSLSLKKIDPFMYNILIDEDYKYIRFQELKTTKGTPLGFVAMITNENSTKDYYELRDLAMTLQKNLVPVK